MYMTETNDSFTSRVISAGRLTIPEPVRELLRIKDGDYVRIKITNVVHLKSKKVK